MIYRKYRPRYQRVSSELEDPEGYSELSGITPVIIMAISLVTMGVTLGFVISHFMTGGG